MATPQNTVVVDLGALRQSVEDRVQSGSYASADEVIRAGLEALEREESAAGDYDNELLIGLAEKSLADPRPSILAEEAFRELRAKCGRPIVEASL